MTASETSDESTDDERRKVSKPCWEKDMRSSELVAHLVYSSKPLAQAR
jgi:hypothetical protein